MAIIVSKTFTTRETMMNATLVREWLSEKLGKDGLGQHLIAVSANTEEAKEFGVKPENVFGFWDWVGGRYSVTSAVGIVPLSIHYGFDVMQQFI